MRKLTILAAASLLALPVASEAKPLNELLAQKGVIAGEGSGGRLHYNGGTRLEFPDAGVDMQLNVIMKALYSYSDFDESSGTGRPDTSSFDVPLVRLQASGNMMNGKYSYMLQNDFNGSNDDANGKDSDLRDAYFQWNGSDSLAVRMGQFKVPFGRQQTAYDETLQMVNRGLVNGEFNYGRSQGVMAMGAMGSANYALGLFNGDSAGEGINNAGVDNNHLGALRVTTDIGDYGSRSSEGDYGQTGNTAGTVGLAGVYGQGNDGLGNDYDEFALNADVGVRCHGMSVQGEYFYRSMDFDGSGSSIDDNGFYVQAGYFVVPQEWEVAARFGMNMFDNSSSVDNETEYAFVVNRYLDGHNLKVQTGVTWYNTDFNASGTSDLTDMVADVQVAGYL